MISVSVEIYPEGLWLRHYRPYSILLPEILVPWEKIKLIRSQNSLFGKVHVFAIEAYAGSIKIKGAAGKAIAEKVAHA
jgi:hypothetical protein